jgi:hypothetical protein
MERRVSAMSIGASRVLFGLGGIAIASTNESGGAADLGLGLLMLGVCVRVVPALVLRWLE